MSFKRLALLIAAMSVMAIASFHVSTVLAEHHGWAWLDFEQAAAIGCFMSACVPLFVYAKSRVTDDKILTAVQVVLLIVTALVGSIAPRYQSRTVGLFAIWFISAALGVTVAVRLTLRLA